MTGDAGTEEAPVAYECVDDVAYVTIQRPDRLNAVTPGVYDGVQAGLEQADADDARVVVLRGEGRAFCVGADMKEHDARERSGAEKREYVWAAQEACRALQTHDAPVVTKVQGYAIGAGAELALSTDIVVMAADAEIRFPEVAIGTYVGGGVTYTLPARVGVNRAKELVLTAATLTGEEAGDLGVVNRVVPAADLDDAVVDVAETIASHAPISMRYAKRQFAPDVDRDLALTAEADALLSVMETRDWREGVDAFAEDRDPDFRGE